MKLLLLSCIEQKLDKIIQRPAFLLILDFRPSLSISATIASSPLLDEEGAGSEAASGDGDAAGGEGRDDNEWEEEVAIAEKMRRRPSRPSRSHSFPLSPPCSPFGRSSISNTSRDRDRAENLVRSHEKANLG